MVSGNNNHTLPAARLLALSNTNIPFKRLFVEGFVIVISILLAFAIDSMFADKPRKALDFPGAHDRIDDLGQRKEADQHRE